MSLFYCRFNDLDSTISGWSTDSFCFLMDLFFQVFGELCENNMEDGGKCL